MGLGLYTAIAAKLLSGVGSMVPEKHSKAVYCSGWCSLIAWAKSAVVGSAIKSLCAVMLRS